jgi:NAD(P)-dependent dehydrogenase (short-subunit alcohol dehydrogenase family)
LDGEIYALDTPSQAMRFGGIFVMKMFDLTGRNAVVIGGAGGLGQVIAEGIGQAGARVAICSRNETSLRGAAKEIKESSNIDISCYTVDAVDESSVEALVSTILQEFGRIDILINAQGLNKKFPAEDFPLAVFREMFDVNVAGVMLCCKHFGKHMIGNRYGKIVNISSVRGKIATRGAGNLAYCGTKGALDMITRQLASEFGPHGITVNAIAPTVIETPMMAELLAGRGPNARRDLAETLPLKRMSVPSDCVGPAVFLCSDASSFVTGNIVYPDGGLTAVG